MPRKWVTTYLPASKYDHPDLYFNSEKEAWDWVYTDGLCSICKEELKREGDDATLPCTAEYFVFKETFLDMIKRQFKQRLEEKK